MLNRAARFFPILRELQSHLPYGGTVLEVGSGSWGLGQFWDKPFVGCDVFFPAPPVNNMRAVRCSGRQLAFRDGAFDAVVVSDVMEHIPPQHRKEVVAEALRVARKVVVFGFPCGPAAFHIDRKLYRDYQSKKLPVPVWLEEHMLYPFPQEDLFIDLPPYWKQRALPNESLRFHYWMMRAEMSGLRNFILRAAVKIAPALVERCLQGVNHEPSYRKLFVLTRESNRANALR